jgi:hypothetical protein
MSTLAAAAERLTQPQAEKDEYNHGSLQIRRNTLVIGNTVYPVGNISRVTVSDLRTPVPTYVWIMTGLGVFCLLIPDSRIIGLLLVAAAGYLLYLNWKSKSAADYALSIQMNSGNTAVIMSNNGDFLKTIALELYGVIEHGRPSNATYNIDRSTRIDNITGAVVALGGVQGDIVNNVVGI